LTALRVSDPLPDGPESRIQAPRGSYVAVSVPRPDASGGNVWRIARPFDPNVIRQISEGFLDDALVIVFETIERGATAIVLALTLGETSEPLATRYFRVAVV